MNKYVAHVYVIPEDDANRQVAAGFLLHSAVKINRLRVMPLAGGWRHVLKTFEDEYILHLRKYSQAHVVMLVDFDGRFEERSKEFEGSVPEDLNPRVFVIGSKTTPEDSRKP